MGKQLPHLFEKRCTYVEIRDEFLNLKNYERTKNLGVELSDVEFEIELLKTDETNLDYIPALIVEIRSYSAHFIKITLFPYFLGTSRKLGEIWKITTNVPFVSDSGLKTNTSF